MGSEDRRRPGVVHEAPHDAGVDEGPPDRAHVEGARVLADQSEPWLRARGFTDDEIRHWAEAFVREVGSGDVDRFVRWIAEQERG